MTPDLALLDAAVAGDEALAGALGHAVAQDWMGFAAALSRTRDAVAADPEAAEWGTCLFVLDEPRTLIGWGGYKGPPQGGEVEIGYEVAPEYRGRGLATAAARALTEAAFSDSDVEAVTAHTLAEENPSTGVLVKLRFTRAGDVTDPNVGTVWRWRLESPAPG